jgi:hypothetical protein
VWHFSPPLCFSLFTASGWCTMTAKNAMMTVAGSGKAPQKMRLKRVCIDIILVFRSPGTGSTSSTGRLQRLFGAELSLVQPGVHCSRSHLGGKVSLFFRHLLYSLSEKVHWLVLLLCSESSGPKVAAPYFFAIVLSLLLCSIGPRLAAP